MKSCIAFFRRFDVQVAIVFLLGFQFVAIRACELIFVPPPPPPSVYEPQENPGYVGVAIDDFSPIDMPELDMGDPEPAIADPEPEPAIAGPEPEPLPERPVPPVSGDGTTTGGPIVSSGPTGADYASIDEPNYWASSDWCKSNWIGWVDMSGLPWVYHTEHGYWYVTGASEDNLYIWDPQSSAEYGWFWTSKDAYPWIYLDGPDAWAYYYEGSGFAGGGWFTVYTGNGSTETVWLD